MLLIPVDPPLFHNKMKSQLEQPPASAVLLYPSHSVPSPERVVRAPQAFLDDCSGLNVSVTVSSQPHVPLLGLPRQLSWYPVCGLSGESQLSCCKNNLFFFFRGGRNLSLHQCHLHILLLLFCYHIFDGKCMQEWVGFLCIGVALSPWSRECICIRTGMSGILCPAHTFATSGWLSVTSVSQRPSLF